MSRRKVIFNSHTRELWRVVLFKNDLFAKNNYSMNGVLCNESINR